MTGTLVPAARIRWEPLSTGAELGYVTPGVWLFEIGKPGDDADDPTLMLKSRLPGQGGEYRYSDNPDELKAEAERRLAAFTVSIGATFLDDLPVVSRCECGGLAKHQEGCRWRQGYGSRVISGTAAPAEKE